MLLASLRHCLVSGVPASGFYLDDSTKLQAEAMCRAGLATVCLCKPDPAWCAGKHISALHRNRNQSAGFNVIPGQCLLIFQKQDNKF